MRALQLVACLLLACLAWSAIAEDVQPTVYGHKGNYGYKSHSRDRYKEDYDRYDDDSSPEYRDNYDGGYGGYGGYDGDDTAGDYYNRGYYGYKPDCGPREFPELKPPSCIDPHSGFCAHYNETTCVITNTTWCKQVEDTKWSCTYTYKPADKICRGVKEGDVCDVPDKCTGDSPTCPETFKQPGTTCVLEIHSQCTGEDGTCPSLKRQATKGAADASAAGSLKVAAKEAEIDEVKKSLLDVKAKLLTAPEDRAVLLHQEQVALQQQLSTLQQQLLLLMQAFTGSLQSTPKA